jgi:MFS family permease
LLLAQGVQSQGLDPGTDEGVLRNRCITVDEAIETIGFGKFQLGMLAYTGLVWLADAAEMILLSFIGPAAKCEWGLSSSEEGAISSMVFAGIFLGAYAWGIVSDIHGRRLGFIATALFTFFFGMLSAWSPDYWFLLASRAFVGFGLGGAPMVTGMLILEATHSSISVLIRLLWQLLSLQGGILTVHGVSASIFKRLLACFYGGLLDGWINCRSIISMAHPAHL